jgi:hypothetical protein
LNTDDCYPPILIFPFEEGRRVLFLVGLFPPGGLPPLDCLLAWTVVLAPCFFFSPFFGGFLFIKFGRFHHFRVITKGGPKFYNRIWFFLGNKK